MTETTMDWQEFSELDSEIICKRCGREDRCNKDSYMFENKYCYSCLK